MGFKINGYKDVQGSNPGEFTLLPPGGYVCRIINAEMTKSRSGREMILLYLDIAEGEFAGYFREQTERDQKFSSDKKWTNSGIYRQLIYDNNNVCSRFFKGLLMSLEHSNPNYKVNFEDFDPAQIVNLLIGIVYGHEEYEKQNGDIGNRVTAKFPRDVDIIREGKFKVPELKTLDKSDKPSDDHNNSDTTFDVDQFGNADAPF